MPASRGPVGPVDGFVLAVVRGRLARPDLADLLPSGDDGKAKALTVEVDRLRARLVTIEADYDSGLIDGKRYKIAAAKVQTELRQATAAQVRAQGATVGTSMLTAADPVTAFDGASLMVRRAVLDALCEVRLLPGRRGHKLFDPDTVRIDWRPS